MAEGGEPVIPVDEEPVNPVGGEPVNPAGEVPVNPAAEEPENPAGEEPAAQAVRPVIQLLSRELANSITVLRALLPYLDLSGVLHLSRVCPQWYDIINNDDLLWERLLREEDINNPDKWDMEDNQKWIRGKPCRKKRILLKYRRALYCMKSRRSAKYNFPAIRHVHFDGRTFVTLSKKDLRIYKVSYDRKLSLTQKLLNRYDEYEQNAFYLRGFSRKKKAVVKTNTKYVVVATSSERLCIHHKFKKAYRFYYSLEFFRGNFVAKDIRPSNSKYPLLILIYIKFLFEHLLLFVSDNDTLLIWDILSKKQLYKFNSHQYLKHRDGITFLHDLKRYNVEAYNKEFNLMYIINFKSYIRKLCIINRTLYICSTFDSSGYTISSWDKYTGQAKDFPIQTRFEYDDTHCLFYENIILVADTDERQANVRFRYPTFGYSRLFRLREKPLINELVGKYRKVLIFASYSKSKDPFISSADYPKFLVPIPLKESRDGHFEIRPFIRKNLIVYFGLETTSVYVYALS